MKKTAPASSPNSLRRRRMDDAEVQALRDRLAEAEDTIEALRTGSVDAVVVQGEHGHQVYSLSGADLPYRVYVERMQEGAVTVGSDGLILFCNLRFATMAGSALEKVIGSNIGDHLPFDAWRRIATVLTQRGEVVKHQSTLHGNSPGGVPVLLTASELPLPGHNVICLVVTDLSIQEESTRLRLAKEVAERANVAKDHFLATLSHELRTPLTPVLFAAAMLKDDESVPEAARLDLAMIHRNVKLETRLIDDLLDLTRIASGKLEMDRTVVDLRDVLSAALGICDADIEKKRLRVVSDLAPGAAWLDADADRLQQAFWNLLRNAVKFTAVEGTITLTSVYHWAGSVRVEVRDTGIGFSPEAAGRLFEAFTQADRDITRQFGGLGLGLAISRSIIQAHGGTISARSAGPGKGACFTVDLPLRASGPVSTEAAPVLTEAPPAALRILLVEDHEDTRRGMERLLRKLGHVIVTADCGAAALQQAATQEFDLVISDLGLPDQTGEELMIQLRDRHHLSGIAVSGYGMAEDINRALAAGFVRHFTKPIEFQKIREALKELSQNHPVGEPAPK